MKKCLLLLSGVLLLTPSFSYACLNDRETRTQENQFVSSYIHQKLAAPKIERASMLGWAALSLGLIFVVSTPFVVVARRKMPASSGR